MTSSTVSRESVMKWSETPRNPDPSAETPASCAAAPPFVERQHRGSLIQAAPDEPGEILVDLATQAFGIEPLGAIHILDAEHDGAHLQ